MKTCVLLFSFSLALSVSANEVVEDTNIEILSGSSFKTDFRFRVFQDPGAMDETNIFFDVVDFSFDGSTTFFATLRFVDTNIDEASDWYLVEAEDAFTANNICNKEFEFWGGATKDGKGLILGNEITFPAGVVGSGASSVFLAVNTGSIYAGSGFGLPREIFGWVEINVSVDNIEIIDSAMSYDATGITVGRNFLFGDVNCDGSADLLDIAPFVDLLINGGFEESVDFDSDSQITLLDVSPFVESITNN